MAMRFQFSILTMLICTAVIAVVSAVSARLPVAGVREQMLPLPDGMVSGPPMPTIAVNYYRPPTAAEIVSRLFYWGLPAVAVTLALLWFARLVIQQFQKGRAETVITSRNPLN